MVNLSLDEIYGFTAITKSHFREWGTTGVPPNELNQPHFCPPPMCDTLLSWLVVDSDLCSDADSITTSSLACIYLLGRQLAYDTVACICSAFPLVTSTSIDKDVPELELI